MVKSLPSVCRTPGFNPWIRKIPLRRKWQPTPVSFPGKFHGWRSLYSPWGHKESDTIERLHFTSLTNCSSNEDLITDHTIKAKKKLLSSNSQPNQVKEISEMPNSLLNEDLIADQNNEIENDLHQVHNSETAKAARACSLEDEENYIHEISKWKKEHETSGFLPLYVIMI